MSISTLPVKAEWLDSDFFMVSTIYKHETVVYNITQIRSFSVEVITRPEKFYYSAKCIYNGDTGDSQSLAAFKSPEEAVYFISNLIKSRPPKKTENEHNTI